MFSKQSKKKFSKSYYNSIHTCSIYSWSRTRKHSNFAFLQECFKYTPVTEIPTDLSLEGESAYLRLLTELWAEFGQSKELTKEIELRKDLLEVNLLYLETGDRSLKNDIKIIKAELENLLKQTVTQVEYDFEKEVNQLSQHLGRSINQKTTTVFEYYSYGRI